MSGNELSNKQQEQLSELFLRLFTGFQPYKDKLPDLEKLRLSITDLDAKLKQFGNLNLQNDKTSQLEQTNQLINALALNQEILQVIQKEIAEVTRLRDIEKESPTEKKSETPNVKSLAELYEERLAALDQLDKAAKEQAAMLKARLSMLSKKLKDAEEDLNVKYEKAVDAENHMNASKESLSQAYQVSAEKEIVRDELIKKREDNVTSFDLYAEKEKGAIQLQMAEQFTGPVIENLAAAVRNSETTTDLTAAKVKEKSEEINSACATHLFARARFVAEGLDVDPRFFEESRASFAEKMEAERKGKGNSELDDSIIDSVFQGAAGPLTFNQFNATRDGLETNIASTLDPRLGPDSSAAATKVADEYFASGMTVKLTEKVLKKASENAVGSQEMAEANSQSQQAKMKKAAAEKTHADAVDKFKAAAEEVQKAAQVVNALRQEVQAGQASDQAIQQAAQMANTVRAPEVVQAVNVLREEAGQPSPVFKGDNLPTANTRNDTKAQSLVERATQLAPDPQQEQARLKQEAARKAKEEAAKKAAEQQALKEQEKKQTEQDRQAKKSPANKPSGA